MIGAYILSIIARFGNYIAVGGGVLVVFFLYDNSRVNTGRQQERAAVEKRGEVNAKKAEVARRSVDRIPDDRLRDRHFRD